MKHQVVRIIINRSIKLKHTQKIKKNKTKNRNKRKYSREKWITQENKSKADMGQSIKTKPLYVIDRKGEDNVNTKNDDCGKKVSFSIREKDNKTDESNKKSKESKDCAFNQKVRDVNITDSCSEKNGSDDKDEVADTNKNEKSNNECKKQSTFLKDKHVDK